jgi:hypothetical protein
MYFLLFEGPAHLTGQFVEKLSHGAVVKIAGILRKNLAGEDSDRLAVTCGPTSGIGVDDFAAGKMPDRKGSPRAARPVIQRCAVRTASSRS